MHALILAGGFGTRLASVVAGVPKPLAPVAGKPFLVWQMEYLIQQGITGITLSLHHEWRQIRDYVAVHSVSVPVQCVVEETPLGTGGATAYALAAIPASPAVLVLNGDSFTRLNYRTLAVQHQASGARLTMVLREVPDTGRYDVAQMHDGIITDFYAGSSGKPGLINAGIYIVNVDMFAGSNMPPAFSFEKDFLPPRLAAIRPQGFVTGDYFIDIGTPEDYARACRELPSIVN